tara:strand:+ start:1464 stop:3161 length:1698 start_codon:yes stop_codon:yes gene_type:complete
VSEHLIFIFYIFFLIFSTIGHGVLFSRFVYRDFLELNVGYQGLIGFFSLSLISLITSYIFPHNIVHNIIIHIFGIIGFFFYLNLKKKNIYEIKYLIILILILIIGAYVYKNHDDFPYYHLTYALNLSENRFIIGTGIFSHGFRTFSSLFYYHSILYMPYIKFYLFHIGPFFILIFYNYVIINKIIDCFNNNKINFLFYFSLVSLIFVDIAFYRISEHGTDRSAQILLLLIFLFFYELFYFENFKKNQPIYLNLLLILIFLASSMKAIYYLYLVLVPLILFKKKFIIKFLKKKNFPIILILTLSLSGNLTTNYFNTGCLLYPAEITCIGNNDWSIPKKEVKRMAIHYEWWSKAGGGPNYKSEIEPSEYIKNFTWLKNWIDRHFFNKVSDTLFGILFICLTVFLVFKYVSKKRSKKKNYISYFAYLIPLLFLLEWFLNHPAMRYGGYVLIGLPFFIYVSSKLSNLEINSSKIIKVTIIFLTIAILGFVGRNVIRLNKEINFYKYNIVQSPLFYVENIKSRKILEKNDFVVYTTEDNKMCWASKTPCSYKKDLKSKKFFGLNMVYSND